MGLVLLRNARFPDRLQLEQVAEKEAMLPGGTRKRVPYVGPIEMRFGGSVAFAGALVTGDQVVLGTLPMQALEIA